MRMCRPLRTESTDCSAQSAYSGARRWHGLPAVLEGLAGMAADFGEIGADRSPAS